MSRKKSILENREEEEGRTASIGKALRRFVVSSSRRLVVASSRRLVVVSSSRRLAFVSPEGGKEQGRKGEVERTEPKKFKTTP